MKDLAYSLCGSGWRVVKEIYRFYVEGFRGMTVGRTLWMIILLKLFLFFVVMRLFFFPNVLKQNFDSDAERAGHVASELVREVSPSFNP